MKPIIYSNLVPDKLKKTIIYDILKVLFRSVRDYNRINVCRMTDYNAVYIPISKSAGSTFRKVVFELNGSKGIYYDWRNYPRTAKQDMKKYSVFTFVRDPFKRIISCYNNRVKEGKLEIRHGFNRDISFEEFVKRVHKIPNWRRNKHIKSQYSEIKKYPVDFIGRVENIKSDYEKVMKVIGIKDYPKLRHENRSKKVDYKLYYNKELVGLVQEIYEEDFEVFGYDKQLHIDLENEN